VLDCIPWVRLELANAEGDFLFLFVDAENNRFDLLTLGEDV